MNYKELHTLNNFKTEHCKPKCYTNNGKDPVKFKVTIRAIGMGESVKVKCCGCKKKLDITDFDSW